jgi:hypothetical protein
MQELLVVGGWDFETCRMLNTTCLSQAVLAGAMRMP